MSWLYSQALVEEYLGENSLDGAQSAPLNGSRTQQAYCAPDKMMDFSRLSQFGMTYKPLTENRGEELLTLYLADFRAKTSVLRGGGAGIDGERSGMWREMARIIGEIQPRFVFVENSPRLTSRGLGRVLGDLASMGFDAKWGVLGGKEFGASHSRERIWILASNTVKNRRIQISNFSQGIGFKGNVWDAQEFNRILDDCQPWEDSKRGMDLLGDGVAEWVGQSECLGNGQIPIVAATAWRILSGDKKERI
jgi:hypothetical protein